MVHATWEGKADTILGTIQLVPSQKKKEKKTKRGSVNEEKLCNHLEFEIGIFALIFIYF